MRMRRRVGTRGRFTAWIAGGQVGVGMWVCLVVRRRMILTTVEMEGVGVGMRPIGAPGARSRGRMRVIEARVERIGENWTGLEVEEGEGSV